MKIIATMAEAATVIRWCEKRQHASACRDCVLTQVCSSSDELPNLFAITSQQLFFEDELVFGAQEDKNDG